MANKIFLFGTIYTMNTTLIIIAENAKQAENLKDFLPHRDKINVLRFFVLLKEKPGIEIDFLKDDDIKFALGSNGDIQDEQTGIRAGVFLNNSWAFLVCHAKSMPTELEFEKSLNELSQGKTYRSDIIWGCTKEWLISEGLDLLYPNTKILPVIEKPFTNTLNTLSHTDNLILTKCFSGLPVPLPIIITALKEIANLTEFWFDINTLSSEWEKMILSQLKKDCPFARSPDQAKSIFIGSKMDKSAIKVFMADLSLHFNQIWLFIDVKNESWSLKLCEQYATNIFRLEGHSQRLVCCLSSQNIIKYINDD